MKVLLWTLGVKLNKVPQVYEFYETPLDLIDSKDTLSYRVKNNKGVKVKLGYASSVYSDWLLNDYSGKEVNSLIQPLGYFQFDTTGRWIGSIVTCDGELKFPNLTWKEYFTSFPIRNYFCDSTLHIDTLLKYLNLTKSKTEPQTGESFNYSVIFWSTKMGRQNKRFLKQVFNYLDTIENNHLIIANMDSVLILNGVDLIEDRR